MIADTAADGAAVAVGRERACLRSHPGKNTRRRSHNRKVYLVTCEPWFTVSGLRWTSARARWDAAATAARRRLPSRAGCASRLGPHGGTDGLCAGCLDGCGRGDSGLRVAQTTGPCPTSEKPTTGARYPGGAAGSGPQTERDRQVLGIPGPVTLWRVIAVLGEGVRDRRGTTPTGRTLWDESVRLLPGRSTRSTPTRRTALGPGSAPQSAYGVGGPAKRLSASEEGPARLEGLQTPLTLADSEGSAYGTRDPGKAPRHVASDRCRRTTLKPTGRRQRFGFDQRETPVNFQD